ncbi:DUF1559 family PulG-like putative transporter [Planctomicrobium sp. SH527]|uniref:DUF1559 family PulG-like putative transporter n=1 Tax=Planctomicrobium sp. SH527 TaxID=3448123 RepID=UPI003F5B9EE1
MNVRIARKLPQPRRGGFTLIELLVVISIIAVLASLVLPGVQNARASARRLQCFNNMRNVGLAVMNYASMNGGKLPPLSGGVNSYQTTTAAAPNSVFAPAPWTVHLLPYLDQAGLYDRLIGERTDLNATDLSNMTNSLRNTNIKVFTCPDDPTADQDGALSFAVNVGYVTTDRWDNSASHRIDAYQTLGWLVTPETTSSTILASEANKRAASTGVFWRQDSPTTGTTINASGLRSTIDRMRDGTSQTLLLSENLNNGGWSPLVNPSNTGAGTGDLGFGLRILGTATEPTRQLDEIGASTFTLAALPTPETASRINANLTATSGSAPRPSSFHPQVVNAIFCDGHGQTLSQGIADSVYARLLSPNGNAYGHAILSENSF